MHLGSRRAGVPDGVRDAGCPPICRVHSGLLPLSTSIFLSVSYGFAAFVLVAMREVATAPRVATAPVVAAVALTDDVPTAANARAEKQKRRRARELARLDQLLDAILQPARAPEDPLLACLLDVTRPLRETGRPSGSCLTWDTMAPSCDPCRLECHASSRMATGQPRGDRKREQVEAFAWLLESLMLPSRPSSATAPTIIDAGCSTGSLLLPLAHAFPQATFVAVDLKSGSLARLRERADAAGAELSRRVVTWEGRIEDYDGPCDCVVSLHACGGASDAALQLAHQHSAPFAVSPCCVGKLSFGTNVTARRESERGPCRVRRAHATRALRPL